MSNDNGTKLSKLARKIKQVIAEIEHRQMQAAMEMGIAPGKVPLRRILTPEERARLKVILELIQ